MAQIKHLFRGKQGEDLACSFLEKCGYKIKARNYTNSQGIRLGEIDIIAEKKGRIVFVEVKTRVKQTGGQDLLPEQNINRAKLNKLSRIAEVYMRSTKQTDKSYGFDAVTVVIDNVSDEVSIRHLQDIFL